MDEKLIKQFHKAQNGIREANEKTHEELKDCNIKIKTDTLANEDDFIMNLKYNPKNEFVEIVKTDNYTFKNNELSIHNGNGSFKAGDRIIPDGGSSVCQSEPETEYNRTYIQSSQFKSSKNPRSRSAEKMKSRAKELKKISTNFLLYSLKDLNNQSAERIELPAKEFHQHFIVDLKNIKAQSDTAIHDIFKKDSLSTFHVDPKPPSDSDLYKGDPSHITGLERIENRSHNSNTLTKDKTVISSAIKTQNTLINVGSLEQGRIDIIKSHNFTNVLSEPHDMLICAKKTNGSRKIGSSKQSFSKTNDDHKKTESSVTKGLENTYTHSSPHLLEYETNKKNAETAIIGEERGVVTHYIDISLSELLANFTLTDQSCNSSELDKKESFNFKSQQNEVIEAEKVTNVYENGNIEVLQHNKNENPKYVSDSTYKNIHKNANHSLDEIHEESTNYDYQSDESPGKNSSYDNKIGSTSDYGHLKLLFDKPDDLKNVNNQCLHLTEPRFQTMSKALVFQKNLTKQNQSDQEIKYKYLKLSDRLNPMNDAQNYNLYGKQLRNCSLEHSKTNINSENTESTIIHPQNLKTVDTAALSYDSYSETSIDIVRASKNIQYFDNLKTPKMSSLNCGQKNNSSEPMNLEIQSNSIPLGTEAQSKRLNSPLTHIKDPNKNQLVSKILNTNSIKSNNPLQDPEGNFVNAPGENKKSLNMGFSKSKCPHKFYKMSPEDHLIGTKESHVQRLIESSRHQEGQEADHSSNLDKDSVISNFDIPVIDTINNSLLLNDELTTSSLYENNLDLYSNFPQKQSPILVEISDRSIDRDNSSEGLEISDLSSETDSDHQLKLFTDRLEKIDTNIKRIVAENNKQNSFNSHMTNIYQLLMENNVEGAKKYIRTLNGNKEIQVIDNEYNRKQTHIKKIYIQKQIEDMKTKLNTCAQKMDVLLSISREMKSDIYILLTEFKNIVFKVRSYSHKLLDCIIKSLNKAGCSEKYYQSLEKRDLSLFYEKNGNHPQSSKNFNIFSNHEYNNRFPTSHFPTDQRNSPVNAFYEDLTKIEKKHSETQNNDISVRGKDESTYYPIQTLAYSLDNHKSLYKNKTGYEKNLSKSLDDQPNMCAMNFLVKNEANRISLQKNDRIDDLSHPIINCKDTDHFEINHSPRIITQSNRKIAYESNPIIELKKRYIFTDDSEICDIHLEQEWIWLHQEYPKNVSRILLGIALLSRENKKFRDNTHTEREIEIRNLRTENIYLQNSLSMIQEKYINLKKANAELYITISTRNDIIQKAKNIIKTQRKKLKLIAKRNTIDNAYDELLEKIQTMRVDLHNEKNEERKLKILKDLSDYEKRLNDLC